MYRSAGEAELVRCDEPNVGGSLGAEVDGAEVEM